MFENIEPGQILYMENVVSYRGLISRQEDVADINNQLGKYIVDNNALESGPTVTITHSIETKNGQPSMDLEIKIPLNKAISVSERYGFVKDFKVDNALKMRIIGNPQNANTYMEVLQSYIDENNLIPVTPVYVATIKEAESLGDINNVIVDVYVGVQATIL